MSKPVAFPGHNIVLGKPLTLDDQQCGSLPIYGNGVQCVSCWELDDIEIAEVVRSRRIWLSVWSGHSQPPVYVGTEDGVRQQIADNGAWKRE